MNAGTKLAESAAMRTSHASASDIPAPGGGAVHGGDHRLLERADREHVPVVVVAQVLGDVARAARELLQVLPDAEAAPGAGDHDGADGRVPCALECVVDPRVHGRG